MNKLCKIAFSIVLSIGLCPAVFGAVYTVTKIADTSDGTCDSDCSLREAVVAANGTADNDTIIFGTLFNAPQTITLGGTDIIISNNGTLTIFGPGADKLTVSGNNVSRVFTNNTGSVATIANLRVTGGTGVSTVQSGRGGGVYNNGGTLTLSNLVISGNMAANGGGANNAGTATLNIVGTAIFNNTATGAGGALQNFAGNTTNIRNSSIYNNTCNSNLTGGGVIQANGTVNITNSTFSGNTANTGSGGAIYFNGTALSVTNSTIVGNTSTLNGGGIHKSTANLGVVRNTIIANNNGAAGSVDATGAFNSEGNNIIGSVGTSTGWIMSDLQNTNPLLSPLGFYGGNGFSYALLSGSPAINAGQNCVIDLSCAANNPPVAITTDQRGATRANVDIGAFEGSGSYRAVLPVATLNQAYSAVLSPNVGSFTFTNTGGSPPAGVFVNTGNVIASVSGTPFTGGVHDFAVTVSNGMNSAVVNYRLYVAPFATASIGGRITDSNGNGIGKVSVILTDSNGNTRRAISNPFGYYNFGDFNIGEVVRITVASKVYTFANNSQFFLVNDQITNADFTAAALP